MKSLKALERRMKALEPDPVDRDSLVIDAVSRVLDGMGLQEAACYEEALQEVLSLYDVGFSEPQIEGMLTPESKKLLEDLEERALCIMPKVMDD